MNYTFPITSPYLIFTNDAKVCGLCFWLCFQCWGVSASWRRSWWSPMAASHLSGRSCPASPPSCRTLRAFSRKQRAPSRRRRTATEPASSNSRGMRWIHMSPPGPFWVPLPSLICPPALPCHSVFVNMDALVNSPVKELTALPPSWESVLAWSPSSKCCLLYLLSQSFKQCWVLLDHSDVPGLKRHKKSLSLACTAQFLKAVRERFGCCLPGMSGKPVTCGI